MCSFHYSTILKSSLWMTVWPTVLQSLLLHIFFVRVTMTVFLQSWGHPTERRLWPNSLALRSALHQCQTGQSCHSWGGWEAQSTITKLLSLLLMYLCLFLALSFLCVLIISSTVSMPILLTLMLLKQDYDNEDKKKVFFTFKFPFFCPFLYK